MKYYIMAFIVVLIFVSCSQDTHELSQNTNTSVEEQIDKSRKLIIPAVGTEKNNIDSIYGTPREIKELEGKGVSIDYPMYVYELLPPIGKNEFHAFLYVTYRDGRSWRAGINHICVTKGRPIYREDSLEYQKQKIEIEAENRNILDDLKNIVKKFGEKLKDASWNKKAMTDEDIKSYLTKAGVKYRGYYNGCLYLQNTGISDLTPLQSLSLQNLDIRENPVSDISPLKGMPLESLDIGWTKVTDLFPLVGMPLKSLYIRETKVNNLNMLISTPLKNLLMDNTEVEDLSPLKDMPLVELTFTPHRITDGIDCIREIKALKQINSIPSEIFWKLYDAGYVPRRPRTVSAVPILKEGKPWEGPFPTDIAGKRLWYQGIIIYKDGKPWSGCIPRGGGDADHWFLDAYVDGVVVSTKTLREYREMSEK